MLKAVMSREIRESDWKLFRELHPVALARFCEGVLGEITRLAADATKTPHDRYCEIYQLVRKRDKWLADAFDDKRRSTALLQMAIIHARGLLTEEEVARFSPEARDAFARTHLTNRR